MPWQTIRPRPAHRASLEKAGGLFEAFRLSFRTPRDARCAVVVCHGMHDVLTARLKLTEAPENTP